MHNKFRPALTSILIGLPFGALCIGVAMLVMGMGHGWDAPLTFALFSLIFFPLAIFRLRAAQIDWRDDVSMTLLIIMIVLMVSLLIGPILSVGVPITAIHLQGWLLIIGMGLFYVAGHALLARYQMSALWGDTALLGFALICNLAIYSDATSGTSFSFRGNVFEYLWLAIWAGWQLIALLAFARHLRERQEKVAVA
jgi:hypothetical protein